MTPKERAIDTLRKNWVEGKGPFGVYPLNDAHLVSELEEMILTDREALQSEIVKRLQLERCDHYSTLGINAAIGIVQAVFDQPEQPEGLNERLMISQEEFNRCIKQANENVERIRAESDCHVLAEREACAFRIAQLHKWQIEDQETIRQLNEANMRLAKENQELAQKLKAPESPKITFAGIQPD